jgi:hypothetical protein
MDAEHDKDAFTLQAPQEIDEQLSNSATVRLSTGSLYFSAGISTL